MNTTTLDQLIRHQLVEASREMLCCIMLSSTCLCLPVNFVFVSAATSSCILSGTVCCSVYVCVVLQTLCDVIRSSELCDKHILMLTSTDALMERSWPEPWGIQRGEKTTWFNAWQSGVLTFTASSFFFPQILEAEWKEDEEWWWGVRERQRAGGPWDSPSWQLLSLRVTTYLFRDN